MAQSKFLTLSGLSKYDTKIKEWLKDNINALGNKAFVHMCSLEAKETYNAFKITTNWTKSQNFMPTINIRGYAYQRKETIDCDIVMYHYNNEACNYSLTNKGSYPINVYQTFENNIQVFYIDPGEYFGMFNVFVYGGMGTEAFSGWTMTTATAVSGTKIEQKPIATSITGNANYASSAGSSTYADRLGNANSYYTKTSLDTALSGKANTSHGNHVPAVQIASNKVFLRNDNTWQTITPANIGAAATTHGNHVPTVQTASNKVFLRNDNTWQTVTPANIGAAEASHKHTDYATTTSVEALTTIVSTGLTDLSTKYGTLTTSITNLQTTLGNVQTQVGTNTDKISVLDVAVAKLKDNKGSATKPIYWKDGTPTECTYKLEKDVPSNALFTDTNYYITGFSWVNGTTAGPTGTITRNGTSNITVNAIPAASGTHIVIYDNVDNYEWSSNATPQSGIVTTGTQSFSGQKIFNNGIWIGTNNYEEEVGTDNVKIHFGDTSGVWIGEEHDDILTLASGATKITVNQNSEVVNIEYGTLTVNDEQVALQSDITPPVKYTTKTQSFASTMYLDNPTANYCTLCSFTNTISVGYPYFYIRFNTSYADGSMFHFIIKKTTNQTVTQYMVLYITTNISGASVKIAGLNTNYAYINKAFTSLEVNVLYSNKVFYAIINQYK